MKFSNLYQYGENFLFFYIHSQALWIKKVHVKGILMIEKVVTYSELRKMRFTLLVTASAEIAGLSGKDGWE